MPKVTLSKEIYERVTQFKKLVEAVAEAELDVNTCTEVIIQRGIELMLNELLGQVGEEALLTTVQEARLASSRSGLQLHRRGLEDRRGSRKAGAAS